jgi:hypothetical protein
MAAQANGPLKWPSVYFRPWKNMPGQGIQAIQWDLVNFLAFPGMNCAEMQPEALES